MNENKELEIIDAEVVDTNEDVVELEELETIDVEETSYTDEEIQTMFASFKEDFTKNAYEHREETFQVAQQIASNSMDYLDSDTYLWVMYAYAQKYAHEENPDAQRFCHIRMRDVLDAQNGKRKKHLALTFVETTLPESIKEIVTLETNFIDDITAKIKKRMIMMQIIMVTIFMVVLYLMLGYSIVMTLGFGVALFAINYRLSIVSVVRKFRTNQTTFSKEKVSDEELVQFDLPVLNS